MAGPQAPPDYPANDYRRLLFQLRLLQPSDCEGCFGYLGSSLEKTCRSIPCNLLTAPNLFSNKLRAKMTFLFIRAE